jgi:hypothetical protein
VGRLLYVVVSRTIRTREKGDEPMKHMFAVLAILAALALPMIAVADDTVIPPEANWTPTPPARPRVDAVQLLDLLVQKGVLTPVDQAHLTQSGVVTPPAEPREMDRHDGLELATSP